MEKIKVHDWFASRFLNPDKDPMALISEGITPDTSEIKDRDFYKSKEKVKETFKTDSGGFDEEKYNKVYDQFIAEYNYLSAVDSENFILNAYEKSSSNFSTDFGKIIDQSISVDKVANPLDLSKGVSAVNEWSTPTLSKREAAQKNQYWDNDLQKWSKNTVNEDGLLGVLSGKPLVYATWDEDGEHVDKMTGETVKHKKGEWKTDEFGNYYAETVNNEEALDKQFVTWSEVVSDDESPWNSIDIFDSDSLEQNIPRTILKAGVMAAATMLNPYVAGTIFYTTSAINLARVLPQISKSVSAFFGVEEFDALNKWDNYMRRFGHSTSDYSQENFFSFENIVDLAIDSYMQYGTQKAIAKIPERIGIGKEATKAIEQVSRMSAFKLYSEGANLSDDMIRAVTKSTQAYRNAEKLLNKASKVSSAISRAYLVATSVEDVYNQSKLYGFDSQTAGVISLAAYAGVGALFASDYGRGLLYNSNDYELAQDIKALTKQYLKNNAAKISKDVSEAGADSAVKKSVLKKWGEKISKLFTDHLTDIKSGKFSVVQGGLAEGFEEVAEEISQDTAYQVGKAWQSVKELFTGKEYNNQYNYLDTDPLSRYGSSFFGGAIGGAIFKMSDRFLDPAGKAAYDNWRKIMGGDNSEIMKQLVLYTSQGKKDLILNELQKLKKTPLASTSVSAFTGGAVKNEAESQNAVLFGMFEKAINDIDSFLSNYNLKIDKDRFGDVELIRGIRASWLVSQPNGGKGLQDSLFEDYQTRAAKIVSLQGKISDKRASITDTTSEEEKSKINSEINKTQKLIDNELDQIRNLVDGKDDSYLGRLMLETSKQDILDKIVPTSKDGWANNVYGVDYESLPAVYQRDIDDRMTKFAESGELQINYMSAWKLYKNITNADDVKKVFNNIQGEYEHYGLDQLNTNEDITQYNIITEIIKNTFPQLRQFQSSQLALYVMGKNAKFNTEEINIPLMGELNEKIYTILSDDTASKLAEFLDSNLDAEEQLQFGIKPEKIDNDQYIRYLIELNKVDLENIKERIASVEKRELESLNIKTESIDNIIATINSKVSKLDIISILNSLESRQKQEGEKFLLEENDISSIEEILSNLDLIDAIVTGSDETYTSRLVGGVPFGANNFLNQTWKDKGMRVNLGTIDTTSTLYTKDRIEELKNKFNSILAVHRENSVSVVSTQKRIGIKVRELKIKAIKTLINSSGLSDTIFSIIGEQLQFPEIEEDIQKLTDEQYIELDVKYRRFLNEFEKLLYKYYHECDEDTKNIFVKKLQKVLYSANDKWFDDPNAINIETLNKQYLNGATIYSWIVSCILGNSDVIYKEYKNFINVSDKYPFDSQEEIIIMACKFALASPEQFNELTRFFNLNGQQEDDINGLFSIPNILKIICSGGTGKSNVIIPAILQIVKNLGKTKFFAAANTDAQLKTLQNASDSITPENSLLISDLVENINNPAELENYRDSVIIIDECTNINRSDLEKLNKISEDYNIRILTLGDTTQHGIGDIDHAVALFPPILNESFRSLNNIASENNKKFTSILGGTSTDMYTRNFASYNSFTYYDDGTTFAGIKYEALKNQLFIDKVESFLRSHNIPKDASILLFTEDAITEAKLLDYPNITVANKIEDVQGIEWDYVFTNSPLLQSKESDKEDVKGDERNHIKDLYTLFSRAKEGVLMYIQPTVHINRTENILNIQELKFPPVKFGYINNAELLSTYTEFKKQVFDKLNFDGDIPTSITSIGVKPVDEIVIDNDKDETVPISTGFILQDDFNASIKTADVNGNIVYKTIADVLNITPENYILLRNLLYLYLASNKTDDSLKSQIDHILANSNIDTAEFLISIEHRHAQELLLADNNGTLGSEKYPWLVYHVELKNGTTFNIHLGMFPDFKSDTNVLNKTSKFNEHLMELCHEEDGLYNIPDNITFSRSANVLDFRNNADRNVVLEYANGESRIITSNPIDGTPFNTLGAITSSLPCFFRKYSGSENVPVDEILKTVGDIEQIYKSLYQKLKNIPEADLALLTDLINYKETYDEDGNRKIEFHPRQMPKLLDRFVIFASSKVTTNSESSYQKLTKLSKQYLLELQRLKTFLDDIDKSLDSKIDLVEIQKKLKTKILFSVSPIVFSPDVVSKNEINTYIDDVCSRLNQNEIIIGGQKAYRGAYNRAIGVQFAMLTQRLAYLSTLTDAEINSWQTSRKEYLSKDELNSLIKFWNRHKDGLITAYKNVVKDEDGNNIIKGLQLLLDATKKKQNNLFPTLFNTEAFKAFLKEFYTDYSYLATKLNMLSGKYGKINTTTGIRVAGKDVWAGYLHSNLIKDNGIIIDFDSTAVEINGTHIFALNGIVVQQSKLQIHSSSNITPEDITEYQSSAAILEESDLEEIVQEEGDIKQENYDNVSEKDILNPIEEAANFYNIRQRIRSVISNLRPALQMDIMSELKENEEFINKATQLNDDNALLNLIKESVSEFLRNNAWPSQTQSSPNTIVFNDNNYTLADWLDENGYYDFIQNSHRNRTIDKNTTQAQILEILKEDEEGNKNIITDLKEICKL